MPIVMCSFVGFFAFGVGIALCSASDGVSKIIGMSVLCVGSLILAYVLDYYFIEINRMYINVKDNKKTNVGNFESEHS